MLQAWHTCCQDVLPYRHVIPGTAKWLGRFWRRLDGTTNFPAKNDKHFMAFEKIPPYRRSLPVSRVDHSSLAKVPTLEIHKISAFQAFVSRKEFKAFQAAASCLFCSFRLSN